MASENGGSNRKRWLLALGVTGVGLSILAWYAITRLGYSNIEPGDYVGPQTCGSCHEKNFQLWQTHSHRKMNLAASEETVQGDFSGVTLAYGPGKVKFERMGKDFTMAVYEGDRLVRRHKVTRTVGSLYMQYYIGSQIFGPEPPDHPTYSLESKLPFAYCFALGRWLPEPYLDSTVKPESNYLDGAFYIARPPLHNWNISCMTCHNTYPYRARIRRQAPPVPDVGIWQGGFPRGDVETATPQFHQGKLQLGPDMRAIDVSELITLGISCESCHFGGREHAKYGKPIRFVPTSSDVTVRRKGSAEPVVSNRKDHYVVNSICNQCHNSQLDRYPNGAAAVNSNEATDIIASACESQIKCTDCHNPHRKGPRSGSPDQPAQVAACTKCHEAWGTPAALAAHSRHPAESGVNCLDCHMPRIVAGLDTITRSHQIGSPINAAMLATASPNACNLCHLDRSIGWTLEEFAKGWGKQVQLGDELLAAYGGSFTKPMGEVWLQSPNKFTRLAAAEAYSRSPLVSDPAPYLLEALDDEQAFNRTVALVSLERILGRHVAEDEYALLATKDVREKQLAALRLTKALSVELARGDRRGRAHTAENRAPEGTGHPPS